MNSQFSLNTFQNSRDSVYSVPHHLLIFASKCVLIKSPFFKLKKQNKTKHNDECVILKKSYLYWFSPDSVLSLCHFGVILSVDAYKEEHYFFFLNQYLHCVDFKASICVIPIEPVFQWVLNTFQVIACNSLICCRL